MTKRKLHPWEKESDYKDFVYLRIPKSNWEEWEKKEKQGKAPSTSFGKLKAYRIDYEWKIEKKKRSAKEATRIKKARTDMKIYKTLERLYSSLLKTNDEITPYKLAKEAGVSYPKAKKFWEENCLDIWIKDFKKDSGALKKFLTCELAESLVYSKGNKQN